MAGFGALARMIFGTSNDRRLKQYRAKVEAITALEPQMENLSDDALRAKTVEFRSLLDNGTQLDDLLVPAFAVVREAAKRTLGQRHYDVQLLGGMVLHDGAIAEMRTGEGKTLVGTLATYLNALSGQGVHIITVNDYLATRDASWMGRVHEFLGLTVGVIAHGLDDAERRAAYACDITYGTNNEFGFDYLRDNMKFDAESMVQRRHHFAIVDEVDSILVDEARTPLIISGPTDDKSDLYVTLNKFIPNLSPEHYEVDEKARSVNLTEDGTEFIETQLREAGVLVEGTLYDAENVTILHHMNQALRAYTLFARDKDYMVRDGEVVIVDEFTGRMMQGRRYSEGLHQALEAKEQVAIQPENQTLASITFQNYFRLYEKLAGMTGTASTEADEFLDIYKLEVVEIPTNLPVQRIDDDDEIYRKVVDKERAIVRLIEECHARKQPVLVGTTSIEKSEHLAELLVEAGVPHQVLNARYHEQEAYIVAQAGVPGAVTIATNMAGRGTDIQLGGNADMRIERECDGLTDDAAIKAKEAEIRADIQHKKDEALAAGGLFVIGTERHESRRIDNQLRGRSGRQGDPGHSKFFLSLQDDLMRIFGSERLDATLSRLGLKDDEALYHPFLNTTLEKAQKRVEARNFDIRKNLLKFDNVMNDQRKVIYEQRRELMDEAAAHETVQDILHGVVQKLVAKHIPEGAYPEQWTSAELQAEVLDVLGLDLPIADWAREEGIADDDMQERIYAATQAMLQHKEEGFGPQIMRQIERLVVLQTLDHLWRDHLVTLDHLRQVIGWRGYAQRDPLNEYKAEAFALFEILIEKFQNIVASQIMRVEIVPQDEEDPYANAQFMHQDVDTGENEVAAAIDPQNPETWGKVSRNELCPCGSGKKYKHCHGSFDV